MSDATEGALRAQGFERVTDLDDAWRVTGHGAKLRAVRGAARGLREKILAGPTAKSVRTLPRTTLAYPSKFAFWSWQHSPAPFVSMTHRTLLVQCSIGGATKNILFNPSDVRASRRTPYFASMIAQIGPMSALVAREFDPIEAQLEALGLSCDDVDFVAFDHLHTQDLRPILGTSDGAIAAKYPNAKLLVPRCEWDDWDDLHPMQRAWFVPDGKQDVRADRVLFTDGDLKLGDGVYLVRTPGHTSGNQSIVLKTDTGIWASSENGVCVDNYNPRASKIPGLASTAALYGLDYVLNANTPEFGATQYTSMALEDALVDRAADRPEFPQVFSSSEATPVAFAPWLAPTYQHREIRHGRVLRRQSGRDERVAPATEVASG
ncbi:MAG: hypothetical protein JNK05_10735 [Myxococcales bacterium]|nr:hypothetical protein [Myxococcales bacterium]